jgi:hypothetical protein
MLLFTTERKRLVQIVIETYECPVDYTHTRDVNRHAKETRSLGHKKPIYCTHCGRKRIFIKTSERIGYDYA